MSVDDAVRQVAREKAEAVSFDGYKRMLSFIEKTFGVTFPWSVDEFQHVRQLIEARNMVAHNHSRKNAKYCRNMGEPISNVGQSVSRSIDDVRNAGEQLRRFVEAIDSTLDAELLDFKP